jgi:hypothetical protein
MQAEAVLVVGWEFSQAVQLAQVEMEAGALEAQLLDQTELLELKIPAAAAGLEPAAQILKLLEAETVGLAL